MSVLCGLQEGILFFRLGKAFFPKKSFCKHRMAKPMPGTEKMQDPAINARLSSACSRGLEFLLTGANLHSESIKHFQMCWSWLRWGFSTSCYCVKTQDHFTLRCSCLTLWAVPIDLSSPLPVSPSFPCSSIFCLMSFFFPNGRPIPSFMPAFPLIPAFAPF